MIKRRRLLPCLIAGFFGLTAVTVAAPANSTLDDSERTLAGGRTAVVAVKQGEIKGTVKLARAGGMFFGVVGAVVDASRNAAHAHAEEDTIKPLRDALVDYSFDEHALDSTKAVFERLSWLGVNQTEFSKEFSDDSILHKLDAAETPEVIYVSYDYELSSDFSWLRVLATYTILRTKPAAGEAPKSRIMKKNVPYQQSFVYVVSLAGAGSDVKQNVARWAADNAHIARTALEGALGELGAMAERNLNQTASDATKLDTAASTTLPAGGTVPKISGKLIDKTDSGTLVLEDKGAWTFVATPMG